MVQFENKVFIFSSHRYFFETVTQKMKIQILCKSIKCDLSNKWKGILHRITIWNQKLNQCNTKESALKMGQIFLYFEDCSKSARWMFLFLLITYSYTPILHKNAEKPTVIWLSTQNSFKSTVWYTPLLNIENEIRETKLKS